MFLRWFSGVSNAAVLFMILLHSTRVDYRACLLPSRCAIRLFPFLLERVLLRSSSVAAPTVRHINQPDARHDSSTMTTLGLYSVFCIVLRRVCGREPSTSRTVRYTSNTYSTLVAPTVHALTEAISDIILTEGKELPPRHLPSRPSGRGQLARQ
jgi:hypothetical protein